MRNHYPLFSIGDFNAFFALFLDNVVNLVILFMILTQGFGFPGDFIFQYIIPGTALGVLFGDLMYSWLAIRLAKKTNRNDVTAIPLGLDTPSTIGLAVSVLGPAYLGYRQEMNELEAARMAWYIGMAVMIWMGVVKIITSFIGRSIQKVVPQAGLLGSLAGIGIVWLSANQFIKTMEMPLVGLISLSLVLLTLVSSYRLPGKIPGAAAAVVLGVTVYHLTGYGEAISLGANEQFLHLNLPTPQSGGFSVLFTDSLRYLPVAIPFGFLTIIGGINVTEGARMAGDDYHTRDILITEAFATFLAGIFGGVSQSTPYIGHSAYKKMGAKVGYTLLTGILIGIGGFLGVIDFLIATIPEAAVSPILIFIGFEITAMAYQMTPTAHNMAVTFAIIPSILNFGYIKVKTLFEPMLFSLKNLAQKIPAIDVNALIPITFMNEFPYLQALAQGYILTGMLWGSVVAFLIDGKAYKAVVSLLIGSLMSLFGFIHSATSTGQLYLPWKLNLSETIISYIPIKFASAYLMAAIFIAFLSWASEYKKKKNANNH